MYKANVYQIMFGSPSDITKELTIVQEVLSEWNTMHSQNNGIVLLPIHWSTNSYPALGKHPQKILNKQVVEKSDMLVCVFGTKIGTATDTAESGTIEELQEHLKDGKPVMVFFKNSTDNVSDIDPVQLQKLQEFKVTLQAQSLYATFQDAKDFKNVFANKLQLFLNENLEGFKDVSFVGESMEKEESKIEFDESEIEVLKKWAESQHPNADCTHFGNGESKFDIGDFSYTKKGGRERAEFENFFEKLLKHDYMELAHTKKSGTPVYKLKKAAYDYVETLNTLDTKLYEKGVNNGD